MVRSLGGIGVALRKPLLARVLKALRLHQTYVGYIIRAAGGGVDWNGSGTNGQQGQETGELGEMHAQVEE